MHSICSTIIEEGKFSFCSLKYTKLIFSFFHKQQRKLKETSLFFTPPIITFLEHQIFWGLNIFLENSGPECGYLDKKITLIYRDVAKKDLIILSTQLTHAGNQHIPTYCFTKRQKNGIFSKVFLLLVHNIYILHSH